MTYEIHPRAHELAEHLRDVQQHLVAAGVAVCVIECLEMIQVEVTSDKMPPPCHPLGQVALNLAIARQAGERIGVSRGLDLLRRDLA